MRASDRGRQGEDAAMKYLMREGFTILHRNWRSGRYELDIVASRRGVLHFVEVKCRNARSLTTPEDAITPLKFAALQKAAAAYIALYDVDLEPQFDLVAVEWAGDEEFVRYVPHAMQCSW